MTMEQAIIQSLYWGATLIAEKARSTAKTARIERNVKVSRVEHIGDTFEVSVYVRLEDAPEARAYELGSGIHSTKGAKKTYEIKNRTAGKPLAFYWEKVNKKVYPMKVNHPGVEAVPYLYPAATDNIAKITKEIHDTVSASLRVDLINNFRQVIKE